MLSSAVQVPHGPGMRLAVDHDGARHLLVAIQSTDRSMPSDVVSALTVRRKTYTFDGIAAIYLDVRCGRGDLFGTFDDLLVDIIAEVLDGGSADTALGVIDRWRSLLAVRGRQALSSSAQRGLFAELHTLQISQPAGSIDARVWRGPLQEPHDILTPSFALEVKSVGTYTRAVEFHGPMQLAEPGRPLAVVLVEVDEDANGATVGEVANQVVVGATDRDLAVSRLAMAGLAMADADSYTLRFAVRTIRHLVVGDATPRIVPASFVTGGLPEGLSYLTYGLEIASLDKHLSVGETSLREWIHSVVGEMEN